MKYSAETLESLFAKPFHPGEWTGFLHSFFGADTLYAKPQPLGTMNGDSGHLLGELTTKDKYRTGLFRFEIASGSVLRRKSGLRSLVQKYLTREYDAAIAVFNEAGGSDWRFSYICDISATATAPRRFTYVFGGSASQCHTPVSRFLKLQSVSDVPPTHAAMLDAFSVEALTQQFYNELFKWYEWALREVRFPADIIKVDSRRNAEMTIRLVSRLLFCWFLKQKNIVPASLFQDGWTDPATDASGSAYYKAILQNLFFATLNLDPAETPRKFLAKWGQKGVEGYRYHRFFKPGKADEFIKVCETIPFLNGGLFECLDKDRETQTPKRLDCFSDCKTNEPLLAVPDKLFFDEANGLIPLLSRYNFTVEENTPHDQEIALDPELLGKVFENLLASYNPETGDTARKSTGSFYTPRQIVDYMVDEAVKAANPADVFSLKILDPACGSGAFPMGVLNNLLTRLETADPTLDRYQAKLRLIENCLYGVDIQPIAVQIAKLRCFISLVCDWPGGQTPPLPNLENNFVCADTLIGIKKTSSEALGFSTTDPKLDELRRQLKMIRHEHFNERNTFRKKELRKTDAELRTVIRDRLVAIATKPDPIKIQTHQNDITRLRAERMHVQDEKWVEDAQPEQATLFAAEPRQLHLSRCDANKQRRDEIDARITKLEKELAIEKGKHAQKDLEEDAEKLAAWEPYDQNAMSPFFDPEWMFGIKGGFDIVIGNPPFVPLQNQKGTLANKYEICNFKSFEGAGDMYILFYERGWQLLRDNAHLCFISSNKWMRNAYGKKLRHFFSMQNNPMILIDSLFVFNATVETNILLFSKSKQQHQTKSCIIGKQISKDIICGLTKLSLFVGQHAVPMTFKDSASWVILSPIEQSIKAKIEKIGIPLKDWDISINYGIKTGFNGQPEKNAGCFVVSEKQRNEILSNCVDADERERTAELIRPILRGRDIKRYAYKWAHLYIIATFPALHIDIEKYPAVKNHLLSFGMERLEQTGKKYIIDGKKISSRKKTGNKWFETQDQISYWKDLSKSKIIWKRVGSILCFSIDNGEYFALDSTCFATGKNINFILAVLNSKMGTYLLQNSPKTGTGDLLISVQAIKPLYVPKPNCQQENLILELI